LLETIELLNFALVTTLTNKEGGDHFYKERFCLESWGSFYCCSALPFQPEQNKQPNKMAREVVLIDIDSSGCKDAKPGIKTKGGKK
jgi:hypothetical protein